MEEAKVPLISIITICYNAEQFIERTIQSVVNQSTPNKEYIIIDGQSTDETMKKINRYADRVDRIISEKDAGIYDAMNKGLKMAKGAYITFLNAGDYYVSTDTLTKIEQTIQRSDANILYGDFILYGANRARQYLRSGKLNLNNLKKDFNLCHQSIFVKREIASEYDLSYCIKADYKWIIAMAKKYPEHSFAYLPTPIVYYLRDGFSYKAFMTNITELMRLHREFFGMRQVIKNLDIYLYRSLRHVKQLTSSYFTSYFGHS